MVRPIIVTSFLEVAPPEFRGSRIVGEFSSAGSKFITSVKGNVLGVKGGMFCINALASVQVDDAVLVEVGGGIIFRVTGFRLVRGGESRHVGQADRAISVDVASQGGVQFVRAGRVLRSPDQDRQGAGLTTLTQGRRLTAAPSRNEWATLLEWQHPPITLLDAGDPRSKTAAHRGVDEDSEESRRLADGEVFGHDRSPTFTDPAGLQHISKSGADRVGGEGGRQLESASQAARDAACGEIGTFGTSAILPDRGDGCGADSGLRHRSLFRLKSTVNCIMSLEWRKMPSRRFRGRVLRRWIPR